MSATLRLVNAGADGIEGAGPRSGQPVATAGVPLPPGPALRLVSSTTVPGGRVEWAAPFAQGRPTGVAFVASAGFPAGRIYVCDPDAHIINVLDHNCRLLFSFGGFGSGLGQFDTPTDVAVVQLNTGDPAVDAELLVVADRGNHRLQVFEVDGAFISEIGGHSGVWRSGRFPAPMGSPFFRLSDVPPLPFPSRLEWREPYLDVACACAAIRLDIAAILLPDFTTWIADASPVDLRLAFLRFATDPNRADIPESCLSEIAERLQPTWRRVAALPQHSRS